MIDALEETKLSFAASLINQFAFSNECICSDSFVKQHEKNLNMQAIKEFTTDTTAMVIIANNCRNYFRIPRYKHGLDGIFPMMYQKHFYGEKFDEWVMFCLDLMESQFPDIWDKPEGVQNMNSYMQQYFPADEW